MPNGLKKCHESDNDRVFQIPVNQCQLTLIALLLRNTVNGSLDEALEGQAMLMAFQDMHDYLELVHDLADKIQKLFSTVPGMEDLKS